MNHSKPAGVILAGGRSSRMVTKRKALLELKGRPLLSYAIDSLQPHLEPLLLSCESQTNEFDAFGLPVVPDLLPRFRGPLTGLYSSLQFLADNGQDTGLVLCPCDAPFIPDKLVTVLLSAYQNGADQGGSKPVVAVSYQGVLQPTFSLWHSHHLPVIHEAVVTRGRGGLKHVFLSLPHVIVEWDTADPPPFYNVNTREELDTAAAWLD